jgi:hypothetical protein
MMVFRVKAFVEVAIIDVIWERKFSGSWVKSSLALRALSGLLADMTGRFEVLNPGREKS